MEFLQEINWSPLWISLKTGAVATPIAFFFGIFCARKIMKMKPISRAIWDGILTMPLVLPPTVAGFFLLLIFSLRRPFGKFLQTNFDFKVVQTWKGCVIEWQYLFASSLFATVPVVILFIAIEKHLVGGLTSGGVKG